MPLATLLASTRPFSASPMVRGVAGQQLVRPLVGHPKLHGRVYLATASQSQNKVPPGPAEVAEDGLPASGNSTVISAGCGDAGWAAELQMDQFPAAYEPSSVETGRYEWWESKGRSPIAGCLSPRGLCCFVFVLLLGCLISGFLETPVGGVLPAPLLNADLLPLVWSEFRDPFIMIISIVPWLTSFSCVSVAWITPFIDVVHKKQLIVRADVWSCHLMVAD